LQSSINTEFAATVDAIAITWHHISNAFKLRKPIRRA